MVWNLDASAFKTTQWFFFLLLFRSYPLPSVNYLAIFSPFSSTTIWKKLPWIFFLVHAQRCTTRKRIRGNQKFHPFDTGGLALGTVTNYFSQWRNFRRITRLKCSRLGRKGSAHSELSQSNTPTAIFWIQINQSTLKL